MQLARRWCSSVASSGAGSASIVSRLQEVAGCDVLFGEGAVEKAGEVARAARFPGRVCVMSSHAGEERAGILLYFLQKAGYHCLSFPLPPGPPTVESMRTAEQFARRAGCEAVAAFGGGSVIDSARILALKLTNPKLSLHDYMKVVQGEGASFASAPLMVVPSCPGSGTELVDTAYLSFEEELMLPVHAAEGSMQTVIADPRLQDGMSSQLQAAMGITTMMHLMETYVGPVEDDVSKQLALEGLTVAANALQPDNNAAAKRSDLLLSSMMASAVLRTCPAGVCQALALSAVARYNLLYSETAAAIAPACVEATIGQLEEQDSEQADAVLSKFGEVAAAITGEQSTQPDAVTAFFTDLVKSCGIPGLDDHDFEEADFTAIATSAEVVDSLQAHVASFSREDLIDILSES